MRKIVQEGRKVLRETAKPVPDGLFGSPKLKKIIADMAEVLDARLDGVALAAPQIGLSYRLFVVRIDRTLPTGKQGSTLNQNSQGRTLENPDLEVFINPEIVKRSRRRKGADEGCLSVRGIYGTTKRYERVTLRARRADGTKVERGAGGLLAQIFQHEVDHLNGILFTDHAEHLLKIEQHGPVA